MILENSFAVRIFNLFSAINLVFLACLTFYWKDFEVPLFLYRTLLSVGLVLQIGLMLIIKPTYIHFAFNATQLEIRYYNVFFHALQFKKTKYIQIQTQEFRDFHLQISNYGLTKTLLISVALKNQITNYPPLSISLFSKQKIDELFAKLQNFKG